MDFLVIFIGVLIAYGFGFWQGFEVAKEELANQESGGDE